MGIPLMGMKKGILSICLNFRLGHLCNLLSHYSLLQVDAEKHLDVLGAYEVGVVPYFVFFKVNPYLNILSLLFLFLVNMWDHVPWKIGVPFYVNYIQALICKQHPCR